jgi:hypothetical protein
MAIPVCFAIVAFAVAYVAIWWEEKRAMPRMARGRRR